MIPTASRSGIGSAAAASTPSKRSRLERRLSRIAAGVGLTIAALATLLVASLTLQAANAAADRQLLAAQDLVNLSWSDYQARIDRHLLAIAQLPELREALSSNLDPSQAAERYRRGLLHDKIQGLSSIYPNWQLQIRSATGALLKGDIHPRDPKASAWLFSLDTQPQIRIFPGPDGPLRVEAAIRVRRHVDGEFQTLGYVLLRSDSIPLQQLATDLRINRGVNLTLSQPRWLESATAPSASSASWWQAQRVSQQYLHPDLAARYEVQRQWGIAELLQPELLALLALLILAGAWFGALSHRRLSQPLSELVTAAEQFAAGNFDLRLQGRGSAELGDLRDLMDELSQRMNAQNTRAAKLVYRDSLTGLPNRRLFMEHLSKAVAMSKRQQKRFALMFLDLDGFKHVNDSLGHQAGDQLLIEISKRVELAVRDSDVVAATDWAPDIESNLVGRLGGDEFLILLNDLAHPEDAAIVADRLLSELRAPVHLEKDTVYVGASIGVTLFPDDAGDADALLRNADVAMYQAKSAGKNTYKYYAASMNVSASEQLKIQARLRATLDNGDFQLHLQPVFCSRTGALIRAEALIRWTDAELGPVSPTIFIPIAESSGDVTRITQWVINEVCRRLAEWSGRLPDDFQISFNMSNVDVLHGDMREVLRTAIDSYQLDPKQIVVEITETGLMTTSARPIEVLESLRSLGVGLALDDFGTGYSSLSYLQRFPINELKIDRSFITDISNSAADESIVRAIMSMARSLNLAVTAEGVETEEHLQLLRALGCEKLQGYLFSPPMNADRFIREVARDAKLHRWSNFWVNRESEAESELEEPTA